MTSTTTNQPSQLLGLRRCENSVIANSGWPVCDVQFAGWAPTVSSRFTFSMAGEKPDERKKTANLPTPMDKRHLAHLELRETKDAIWMSRVRRKSKYYCYMVAETCGAKQLRPNIVDKLGLAPCPEIGLPELSFSNDEEKSIEAIAVAAAKVAKKANTKSFTQRVRANAVEAGREAFSELKLAQGASKANEPQELQTVSDSHGKLSGVACMFFPAETVATGSLKRLSKQLSEKIDTLNVSPVLSGAFRDVADPESFMSKATEELIEKVDNPKGHSLFLVRFELHRSGEIRIFVQKEGLPRQMVFPLTVSQRRQLTDDEKSTFKVKDKPNDEGQFDITVTSTDLVSDSAPDFLQYRLQRQVEIIFDFIRDTFHNHYHHTDQDDRMVNAFRTTPENDHVWRLATLQRLMTTVQVGRRSKSEPALVNAMGILSYVEAFQNQIAGVVRKAEKFEGFTENFHLKPHNLRHLESSLKIETNRREKEGQTKLQMLLICVSIFLSAAAIVFAALLRVPYSKNVDSFVNNLSVLSIKETIFFIIGTIIAMAIGSAIVYEATVDRAYTFKLTRKTTIQANRILSAIFVSLTKTNWISNIFGKWVVLAAGFAILCLGLIITHTAFKYAFIFIN